MIWVVLIIVFLLLGRKPTGVTAAQAVGTPSLFSPQFLIGLNPQNTVATQLQNDAEFWNSAAGTPTVNVGGITTEAPAAVPGFSENPFSINPDGTVSDNITNPNALADPSIAVTAPGAGFAT